MQTWLSFLAASNQAATIKSIILTVHWFKPPYLYLLLLFVQVLMPRFNLLFSLASAPGFFPRGDVSFFYGEIEGFFW